MGTCHFSGIKVNLRILASKKPKTVWFSLPSLLVYLFILTELRGSEWVIRSLQGFACFWTVRLVVGISMTLWTLLDWLLVLPPTLQWTAENFYHEYSHGIWEMWYWGHGLSLSLSLMTIVLCLFDPSFRSLCTRKVSSSTILYLPPNGLILLSCLDGWTQINC